MTEHAQGAGPGERQPAGAPRSRTFGERVTAAVQLDPSVYEEVEHDADALGQAAGVVSLAAVANALASLGLVEGPGFVAALISCFASWLVWTGIVWLIGVKMFRHTSDFEELLRTLGFVFAPQILLALAVIPVAFLQFLLGIAVLGMTVVAFVRAVRHALDVDTGRAFFVSVLAVVAHMLVALVLVGLAGLLA